MRLIVFSIFLFWGIQATGQPVVKILRFQHEAYQFELKLVLSDQIIWLDDFEMQVDRRIEMDGQVDNALQASETYEFPVEIQQHHLRDSYFIDRFFSHSHPQLGESMIVDFKDGSFLLMKKDLSEFRFSSPFHSGAIPLQPTLELTNSLKGYYFRFPAMQKNRAVWPLDAGFHVHKSHPHYDLPWFPRSLKLYVQNAGHCRLRLVDKKHETNTLFPMLFNVRPGL